jgi:hypothetical protein
MPWGLIHWWLIAPLNSTATSAQDAQVLSAHRNPLHPHPQRPSPDAHLLPLTDPNSPTNWSVVHSHQSDPVAAFLVPQPAMLARTRQLNSANSLTPLAQLPAHRRYLPSAALYLRHLRHVPPAPAPAPAHRKTRMSPLTTHQHRDRVPKFAGTARHSRSQTSSSIPPRRLSTLLSHDVQRTSGRRLLPKRSARTRANLPRTRTL